MIDGFFRCFEKLSIALGLFLCPDRKLRMENDTRIISTISEIAFLPSGKPAPVVLTDVELIELLRLDGNNPLRTLKFYRDEHLLRGIQIGRKIRYRLCDVQLFLAKKAGGNED